MRYNPKKPADYDPEFPLPIPLGARAVGWIEEEVDAWLT
jgi:prophage regulatory protein